MANKEISFIGNIQKVTRTAKDAQMVVVISANDSAQIPMGNCNIVVSMIQQTLEETPKKPFRGDRG